MPFDENLPTGHFRIAESFLPQQYRLSELPLDLTAGKLLCDGTPKWRILETFTSTASKLLDPNIDSKAHFLSKHSRFLLGNACPIIATPSDRRHNPSLPPVSCAVNSSASPDPVNIPTVMLLTGTPSLPKPCGSISSMSLPACSSI